MARLNKLYAALPSSKLRNMIWARSVKKALLPNKDLQRPYTHLIEEAFFSLIEKYNKKHKGGGQIDLTGISISNGKWMGWWQGTHPSSQYVDIFFLIAPNANKWFQQEISVYPESPVHSLLYAIDLWASKNNSRESAFSYILNIEKTWAPKLRKKLFHNDNLNGWVIGLLPNVFIPSDLPFHYRSLEPASLIKFMVLLGDWLKIDETEYFERWVFDLVSMALLIRAIINPDFEENSTLGGDTVDLSTLVETVFVIKPVHFLTDEDRLKNVWRLGFQKSFNVSERFPEMMLKAAILYRNKLLSLGICQNDIKALDSKFYWLGSDIVVTKLTI